LTPTDDTGDLCDALERLTGDRGSNRRDVKFYRIPRHIFRRSAVRRHGQRHTSQKQPAKGNLHDIADGLRIPRSQLATALRSWSRAQLIAHLEQFTADQFLPLAIRRVRGIP
jgi:hypothetical protein